MTDEELQKVTALARAIEAMKGATDCEGAIQFCALEIESIFEKAWERERPTPEDNATAQTKPPPEPEPTRHIMPPTVE